MSSCKEINCFISIFYLFCLLIPTRLTICLVGFRFRMLGHLCDVHVFSGCIKSGACCSQLYLVKDLDRICFISHLTVSGTPLWHSGVCVSVSVLLANISWSRVESSHSFAKKKKVYFVYPVLRSFDMK